MGVWQQPCTMTSFGWKRKRQLFGDGAAVFNQEGEEEEGGTSCEEQEVDWLSAAKKRRAILLEDSQVKSKRLQQEATVLAENQRYWEAIKYWNEAIELTPRSGVLHEMKSQVLLELGELFPAVEAAECAVKADPTWSIAWQTLARAQVGIGQVEMAISSAQKSLHLDPTNAEVRDDMKWIQDILRQKESMSSELCIKQEGNIIEKRRGLQSEAEENDKKTHAEC